MDVPATQDSQGLNEEPDMNGISVGLTATIAAVSSPTSHIPLDVQVDSVQETLASLDESVQETKVKIDQIIESSHRLIEEHMNSTTPSTPSENTSTTKRKTRSSREVSRVLPELKQSTYSPRVTRSRSRLPTIVEANPVVSDDKDGAPAPLESIQEDATEVSSEEEPVTKRGRKTASRTNTTRTRAKAAAKEATDTEETEDMLMVEADEIVESIRGGRKPRATRAKSTKNDEEPVIPLDVFNEPLGPVDTTDVAPTRGVRRSARLASREPTQDVVMSTSTRRTRR